MSTISYAITVCNELEELQTLLKNILDYVTDRDEIVVLHDSQNGSKEVKEYLDKINTSMEFEGISFHRITYPLNNDFASFKNFLKTHCSKEWIFFIDADETCHENLLTYLPNIIEINKDIEVISVPRENYVKNITQEDIIKWGWFKDERSRINYPDMQMRIMQNKPEIVWINKVHEILNGYKTISHLPYNVDGWCLIHNKTIDRQRKQNLFYESCKP